MTAGESPRAGFDELSIERLIVDDEDSLAGVELYGRLKRALARSDHRFRVPARGAGRARRAKLSWDRALFLNLTFWSGSDVLCDDHIPADVVAHVAWHEVVSHGLARWGAAGDAAPSRSPSSSPSPAALFLSESIASAFDLYLVGRLLASAPESDFMSTQVPLMAERAQEAGLSEAGFAALLDEVAAAPERAFERLRALLFDAAGALMACADAVEAQAALLRFAGHPFEPLLHHYELSNWILYARAYGARDGGPDAAVAEVDAALRAAPDALAWLARTWVD